MAIGVGKVPAELLERAVLGRIGSRDPDVLVGPGYGEDAAVIRVGGGFIAVHSDPITAAEKDIGWLAVNIAANDVAVRGARPRWGLAVILLPEGASEGLLEAIASDIDRASKALGTMVVGGHTEVVPGLGRPIVVMTMIGVVVGRPITTSGARAGDAVIMTKSAGLEGAAIIARDYGGVLIERGVDPAIVERASRFLEMISVVGEALALAEEGLANSMHDPTEGGVLGGVAEIAYASGKGVEVWEESIPVAEETRVIASSIGVDPLRLISSGALIASTPWERAEEALEILRRRGVEARIIGRVLGDRAGAYLVRRGGAVEKIPKHVPDEIYRVAGLVGRGTPPTGRATSQPP